MHNITRKEPIFSIIIVTYNSEEFIRECINSILNSKFKEIEVIIVDNASSDNTPFILNEYKNKQLIKIFLNNRNVGFAKACNIGAMYARGKYLVFLNPDTIVSPNWLSAIYKIFSEKNNIAIIQPLLLDYYDHRKVYSGGLLLLHPFVGFYWSLGNNDIKKIKEKSKNMYFAFATGAALCIRKDVFTKVGGFDDTFFLYFEEIDLNWRVWLAGYKSICTFNSVVYHAGGKGASLSSIARKYLRAYFIHRNWFRHIIKNFTVKNLIKCLIIGLILFLLRDVYILFKNREYIYLYSLIRSIFNNLKHIRLLIKARREYIKFKKINEDVVIEKLSIRLSLNEILSRLSSF